ncbi:MAG TPA: DUF2244 domain-containing protein [Phenylobacterium sp.]|nr:DUF2244 domain-containing protein [Phenylobacterium sp.]
MAEPLYMDAEITPNRSLSRTGMFVLLCLVGAANGIAGTVFWMMGAWPAPIFLGLDVLALWWAFTIHNRALHPERVQVTPAEICVLRKDQQVWRSPTAFTRVALERRGPGDSRVRLSLSGKAMTIAAALSPAERVDFANALERAIADARLGVLR